MKPHSGVDMRSPYSMSQWDDLVPDADLCIDPKPEKFLKPKFALGDVTATVSVDGQST